MERQNEAEAFGFFQESVKGKDLSRQEPADKVYVIKKRHPGGNPATVA